MRVTLDQILALAGRLDDSRDFDAARERFRRFLREFVTDVADARALIDEARYVPDDQHRRALQDLVVLVGRFLGFEVDVGVPPAPSGGPTHHGTWHSPGRLRVLVEVGTLTGSLSSPAALTSSGAAAEGAKTSGPAVVRLFVPTSLAVTATRDPTGAPPAVRVMPVADLLALAEVATTGRLAKDEIARMFEFGIPVDFVTGLLNRAVPAATPAAQPEPAHDAPAATGQSSGFWMASVPPDYATTPEEFLELVVARRHVFGVTDRGTIVGTVRTGDGICFFLPGKGVVGHAWVTSITDGVSDLRDARRFRQVLRLERLSLHLSRPFPLDLETEIRLRAAPTTASRHAQMLLEISAESFRALSAGTAPSRTFERQSTSDDEAEQRPTHGPETRRDRLSG